MPGLRSLVARRKCTTTSAVESELSHEIPIINDFDEDSNEDKISSNFCLNNIISTNDIDDLKLKLNQNTCTVALSPITEIELSEHDPLPDEQRETEEHGKLKTLHDTATNGKGKTDFYEANDELCNVESNICTGMNLGYLETNVCLESNIFAEACQSNPIYDTENCNDKFPTSHDPLCQENCCGQLPCSDSVNNINTSKCSSALNVNKSSNFEKKVVKNDPNIINEKTVKSVLENSDTHYLCHINPIITSASVVLSKNISNPNSNQLKCPNCLHVYNSKSKVTFSMCQDVIKFECTNCEWIVVRKAFMSK